MQLNALLEPNLAAISLAGIATFSAVAWMLGAASRRALLGGALCNGALIDLGFDPEPAWLWVFPVYSLLIAGALGAGGGLLSHLKNRGRIAAPPGSPGRPERFLQRRPILRSVTWWLLASLALLLACVWVALAPLAHHTRLVAGAHVAVGALALCSAAGLLVGSLGAARAHSRSGGRWWRAWLARLFGLTMAALYAMIVLDYEGERLGEFARMAFGPPERNRYTLRLLRGGTEVELSGALAFGVGADLAHLLRENPAVRVLHLDSGGGWVLESHRIARLVEKAGLVTNVARRCESACVHAFAAGRERLVGRSATFALHEAGGPLASRGDLRASSAEERRYLVSRGVDAAFVARGEQTPHDSLWRPTLAEVLAARLADRRAGPDEVALSGCGGELEGLELTLRENPVHQAIFEFEPELFGRMAEAMRTGCRLGQSEHEALGFWGPAIQALLDRDLPRTSDAAALRFLRAVRARLEQAQRSDPRACANALRGRSRPGHELLGADELSQAAARVLIDAHNAPQPPPAPKDMAPWLARAARAAEEEHPGVLAMLSDAGEVADAAARCAAAVTWLGAMAALPDGQGGRLLRHVTFGQAASGAGR